MDSKYKDCFFLVSIFLVLSLADNCKAQTAVNPQNHCWGDWQVSINFGTQMSGIKDEDFVANNYAPLLNVSFAKWFSPSLAIQFGYKGWYFHQIIDDNKYKYGYYYGEAVLNVNSLFRNYNSSAGWSLYLHCGSGYFYNYHYKKPNVCANMGISNNYRFAENFQASLDISAIVGWDIYQGDEDILPGITVGISYLF